MRKTCLLTRWVAVPEKVPASLLPARSRLSEQLPSICLSSWWIWPPHPRLHSSREPSCRKACGGYNELGVYLGVPRPLTHYIINQGGPTLKRNGGPPKPGTLRPDPAGEAGAADFHLFLFVFIIPSCSSSLMCLEGIHGSVYNLFKKPREEKYWALSEKRTWRWMERNGAPFFFAHMEKISRPPLLL